MADRIVIMKDGHIQQVGSPQEVFHHPTNLFVAQFIGAPAMNMLEGEWHNDEVQLKNGEHITLSGRYSEKKRSVVLGIRPDDLFVSDTASVLSGTVSVLEPLGSETLVYVSVNGVEVIAKASGRTPPAVGDRVNLNASTDNMHLFDASSDLRIE